MEPVAVQSRAAREAKEMLNHVDDVRRVTEKVRLKGPVAAVKALAKTFSCEDEKRSWAILASKQALMGSCPESERFVACGIRCWISFAEQILGDKNSGFPPTLNGLLAWSTTFRSPLTFSNYLGYVKTGCLLLNMSIGVFDNVAIRRAKTAIDKRRRFIPRGKMFIRAATICDAVALLISQPRHLNTVMCMLTAYIFLLRVPSECLPIVIGKGSYANERHAAAVFVEKEEVVLKLSSRKNTPEGALLRRSCWCSKCMVTCPVHVLGTYFRQVLLL